MPRVSVEKVWPGPAPRLRLQHDLVAPEARAAARAVLARVVPPRLAGHAPRPAHSARAHVSDQVLVDQPLPLLGHAHLRGDAFLV